MFLSPTHFVIEACYVDIFTCVANRVGGDRHQVIFSNLRLNFFFGIVLMQW